MTVCASHAAHAASRRLTRTHADARQLRTPSYFELTPTDARVRRLPTRMRRRPNHADHGTLTKAQHDELTDTRTPTHAHRRNPAAHAAHAKHTDCMAMRLAKVCDRRRPFVGCCKGETAPGTADDLAYRCRAQRNGLRCRSFR
eukprot:5691605-Pleurochrysis_carterae.AAC.3